MIFLEGIINGMREIWAHKVRSFLSMLGIILGVASLVAMVGLVQGMVKSFRVFFEQEGGIQKIAIVDKEPPEYQQAIAGLSPGRTIADARALEDACPLALHVSPMASMNWKPLRYRGKIYWTPMDGVTPDVLPVDRLAVGEGRFIADMDLERAAPVIVIGTHVAENLFAPNENPIGKSVNMWGVNFTVIGILEHYEFMQGDRNALQFKNMRSFIPITTVFRRFQGNEKLSELNVQVADVESMPDVIQQIENSLLRTHRGIHDFEVRTQEEQLAELQRVERSFSLSLGSVAAISLLVGGIGIMNVMFASINERLREIGVRKAVGARAMDIFVQFLAEAFVISVIGGLLGLAASLGLVELLRAVLPPDKTFIEVTAGTMLMGFSFSAGVGLVAGIFPAFKAAKLDPIAALRYE